MPLSPSQRLLAARLRDRPPPLLDAPLLCIQDRLIGRMADDLIAADALADEGDAIRLLMHNGYSARNVFLLAGKALYEARQRLIAREMSAP